MGLRHLCVLSGDGLLRGIITRKDLVTSTLKRCANEVRKRNAWKQMVKHTFGENEVIDMKGKDANSEDESKKENCLHSKDLTKDADCESPSTLNENSLHIQIHKDKDANEEEKLKG